MRLAQRKKTSLSVYRRHEADCPHKKQGREWTKCNCPLWMQGVHDGEPVRQSLGTRSMQEALRQVAQLEDPHAPLLKKIEDALTAYQNHIGTLEPSMRKRYASTLKPFLAYCEREGLSYMADIAVEDVDGFRATRTLTPATSAKELTILRLFLSFCVERKWIEEDPATKIKVPHNQKPPEVVPFEPNEITRILAACDAFGVSDYERRRARALVLLMRYAGLRISDAATLAKDRIRNGRIFLYTKKTGGAVFLRIPKALEDALAALPHPRGAAQNPRCYFWNETCSRSTLVNMAERTLRAVFKRSEVKGAHAHKFRHTLATETLARGGALEDVADILGISPAVAEKHYAKWSRARQDRIDRILEAVHPEAFAAETSPGLEQPEEETAPELVQTRDTGKNKLVINLF